MKYFEKMIVDFHLIDQHIQDKWRSLQLSINLVEVRNEIKIKWSGS